MYASNVAVSSPPPLLLAANLDSLGDLLNLKIQTVKVASLMWVLAVALGPVMVEDVSRVQQEARQVAAQVHESQVELVAKTEAPVKKAGRTPASTETQTR